MTRTFLGICIAFILLTITFGMIERLFPATPRPALGRRRGFRTDLAYWFFTPRVTRFISRSGILIVLGPIVYLIYHRVGPDVVTGFGPVIRQPLALQVIEILLLGDLIGYWLHRLFHRGRLWPFHAVHHSSTEVDWLSSVRLHPLNDVPTRVLQAAPFVLLGFPVKIVAIYVPFLTLYAIMLHANVDWTYGPLRRVIASPVFHRWHHTRETEALDKNFAGLFPLWDILFGTYYMPKDKFPREFGIPDPMPEGLLGQLAYPFRRPAESSPGPALSSRPG